MWRGVCPAVRGAVKQVVRSMAEERRSVIEEERPSVKGGHASAAQAGSVEELSASAFQKYLHGMDYPGGKQDLISLARKNNAPDAVIQVLEMFSDKTFHSAADVSQEFGRVK